MEKEEKESPGQHHGAVGNEQMLAAQSLAWFGTVLPNFTLKLLFCSFLCSFSDQQIEMVLEPQLLIPI